MLHRPLLILASALLLAPLGTQAASLDWSTTGPTPLAVGDSVTLSITGNDFPGWDLVGGGVEFDFDPAVLSVSNVTIVAPNEFGSGLMDPVIDNASGTARSLAFNTFMGVTTPFTLATVTFTATGAGSSTIALFEMAMNPFAGSHSSGFVGAVGDRPGQSAITFGSTSFTVAPVPLPAAAWLLLSGLGGMGAFARRKRAV